MIGYDVEPDDVKKLVEKTRPKWFSRAMTLTNENIAAGNHVAADGLWSEIKPIFIDIQGNKCGYCERLLSRASVEWDMEHFRPKSRVDLWDNEKFRKVDKGGASSIGYYRLAFDPSNYLVACKVCNTNWKRNFFPVAGKRLLHAEKDLMGERPYLLNPLRKKDDPQRFIEFIGLNPRPRKGLSTAETRRAEVTIFLLGLHDREELMFERASVIRDVWMCRKLAAASSDDAETLSIATTAKAALCSKRSPHSNCANSYDQLWDSDSSVATELASNACAYIASHLAKKPSEPLPNASPP